MTMDTYNRLCKRMDDLEAQLKAITIQMDVTRLHVRQLMKLIKKG